MIFLPEVNSKLANEEISFINNNQSKCTKLSEISFCVSFYADIDSAVVDENIVKLLFESFGGCEDQELRVLLWSMPVKYHCNKQEHDRFTLSSTKSHSYSFLLEDVLSDITSHVDLVSLGL